MATVSPTASLICLGSDRDSRELDDEHSADEDGLLFDDDGPPEVMPEHPPFMLDPTGGHDPSGKPAGLPPELLSNVPQMHAWRRATHCGL